MGTQWPLFKTPKLDQWAIGYQKKSSKNQTFETEIYYKKIKNRLDYIDGADLIANKAVERILLPGLSRAYGFELFYRKNSSKHNYWIAYTLSKSEQKTAGENIYETGINSGRWYNTGHDKTHDFSFVSSYKINNKLTLNTNFIFQTGQPTNYPVGQYQYMDLIVPNYGDRNSKKASQLPSLRSFFKTDSKERKKL